MGSKNYTQDLVINLTSIVQQVQIVNESKQVGTVQIMPKRRVELPAGFSVEANWLARNPKTVTVHTAEQLQARYGKGEK